MSHVVAVKGLITITIAVISKAPYLTDKGENIAPF